MKAKKERSATAIDWKGVKGRLAQAARATQEAQQLSPERARQVLEERAQALARAPDRDASAESVELLVFALGGERYAIEARHVREVFRLADLTPLPGTPSFFVGVTNLRGHILPVVDLRKLFDLPVPDRAELSRVIVLGADHADLGVLADPAAEVIRIRREEILEPPDTGTQGPRDHVRGVTAEALIVLDGAVLLKDPRLSIDQSDEVQP